jgi:hypothetical protein
MMMMMMMTLPTIPRLTPPVSAQHSPGILQGIPSRFWDLQGVVQGYIVMHCANQNITNMLFVAIVISVLSIFVKGPAALRR